MVGELRSLPVKVLAAQLRQCRRAAGGPWLLGREEAGQGPLPVVWMQGTVLAVEAGGARGGSARLQDESGPFMVLGVEQIPKGMYVMVMGLVHSCSPEPILQAVKMTELSDNPIHRSMWSLEVEDLHRNIS
ncbi:protein diaphanous-like protein 3 [Platysternon megacephalum]|uniref:Protein diaphanous-like protein 3 n=1 Tax=Platysternon megacephalum TaxID=55544 RepID=A0A4D9E8S0_9SAUR|nr:protein diaphanous-like protein 3 [Platysternon megacephalum]